MENKATAKSKLISIKREIALPITKVWEAWTEPETFKKWWGPKAYSCPYCTIHLQEGGKYLASMKGPDGKEIFSTGIYKQIVPGKKLVMTDNFSDSKGNIIPPPAEMTGEWLQPLLVTVEMEEKNGKTNLSITHEGIPIEQYNDCVLGWNECIDKMETKLK